MQQQGGAQWPALKRLEQHGGEASATLAVTFMPVHAPVRSLPAPACLMLAAPLLLAISKLGTA